MTTYTFVYANKTRRVITTTEAPQKLEPIGGVWKLVDRAGLTVIINWHLVNYVEVETTP